MKVVQIYRDASMDEIDCKFNSKNICKNLTGISKSCGNDSIKLLYTWKYGGYELLCYGWYDGEPGFENKHDLPPAGNSIFLDTDSSEQLLFGDLFIVKKENKYLPYEVADYGEFYDFMFGGFDNCDSNEEDTTDLSDEDIDIQGCNEDSEEELDELDGLDEEYVADNVLEEDITEY